MKFAVFLLAACLVAESARAADAEHFFASRIVDLIVPASTWVRLDVVFWTTAEHTYIPCTRRGEGLCDSKGSRNWCLDNVPDAPGCVAWDPVEYPGRCELWIYHLPRGAGVCWVRQHGRVYVLRHVCAVPFMNLPYYALT